MTDARLTGDQLVEMLAALANPIRLRIVAKLAGGRDYVSHLAREIGVSRPLLHMHLQRLETAGLVVGKLELSEDGKAMKFYEVADFDLRLTASALAEAVQTLTKPDPEKGPARKEYKRIPLQEQVEVLTLAGDITVKESEPQVHAHVVVGKADGSAWGGHLLQGTSGRRSSSCWSNRRLSCGAPSTRK